METEIVSVLTGQKKNSWLQLLAQTGLQADEDVQQTILVWDNDCVVATGSRCGNLLKCLAVDPARQGDGLLSTVLTALRAEAFREGYNHLFLYTKPGNELLFSSLFFYPVAKTDTVLLMENRQNGIGDFLSTLPNDTGHGTVGAIVMNANPFTYGHQHLIETAAAECERLYVFVLSEDRSRFSAADRLEMVRRGTAHLENVTVLPTGPYLISSATFPTYFLKDREAATEVQCLLDIEIFAKYFVPRFGIQKRFVGTEPFSPMTNRYNEALKAHLPPRGVQLCEIPRYTVDGEAVSASAVRRLLDAGDKTAAMALVPETTREFL